MLRYGSMNGRAGFDPLPRREILSTARRYAENLDDTDDAYQRGLEILLRKAPNPREEGIVPWLKTVVLRTIRPSELAGSPPSTTPSLFHITQSGRCASGRIPG